MTNPAQLPDAELYQPVFSPWRSPAFIEGYQQIRPFTLVSPDRCYVLATLARQARRLGGEFWECGVYKGGTAMLLAQTLGEGTSVLRLFDTFEGMPDTDPTRDFHRRGDFADTSLEAVRGRMPGTSIRFHKGFIPTTFNGLEDSKIAFAHVDVDIYTAVHDCCNFILPRLQPGGFMVFDDYGFPTCPGARKAVDEYFSSKDAIPLVLPTGQALVYR